MEEKKQMSKSVALQESEAEPDDATRFDKSLQELRNLRSQLHYAADYCEGTFLNSTQKKLVVENTKEYICRAVVTVVDHLGNVSANLDHCISETNAFAEAELRIDNLKQRLHSCQLYAHKLALPKLRWSANLPRHHRRYLSTPISFIETSNEDLRDADYPTLPKITEKNEFDTEDVPLFVYTYARHSSSASQRENSSPASVLPVRDGISVLSKGSSPTFHFQLGTLRHRRDSILRRSLQGTEILSLIRRTKKTSSEIRKSM